MKKDEALRAIKNNFNSVENFRKEIEAIRNRPVSRSAIYKALDIEKFPTMIKLNELIIQTIKEELR